MIITETPMNLAAVVQKGRRSTFLRNSQKTPASLLAV